MKPHKLIILSGPSCAGKTPLVAALRQFHPDLAAQLQPVVLYNSRSPRRGERDGAQYHFRSRQQIEELRQNNRYVVLDVRGDLLALDLQELDERLGNADALYEGNLFMARLLQTHPALAQVERLSIFIAPLSADEILYLKQQSQIVLSDLVANLMRRKLLHRTRRQKGALSLQDLEEVERRCTSAYREMQAAHHFDHVIPNHDGEDSDNWTAFYYPLGDARKTLQAVVAILRGTTPVDAEKWEPELLP